MRHLGFVENAHQRRIGLHHVVGQDRNAGALLARRLDRVDVVDADRRFARVAGRAAGDLQPVDVARCPAAPARRR